jgi:hypothetical protein
VGIIDIYITLNSIEYNLVSPRPDISRFSFVRTDAVKTLFVRLK